MRTTARRNLHLNQLGEKGVDGTNTSEVPRDKSNAYQAILGSNLPSIEKERDRVAQKILTLLVGGSAATMRVMSRVIFHVASEHHVLSDLRSEPDVVMPTLDVQPQLEILEQQRYLVGC